MNNTQTIGLKRLRIKGADYYHTHRGERVNARRNHSRPSPQHLQDRRAAHDREFQNKTGYTRPGSNQPK